MRREMINECSDRRSVRRELDRGNVTREREPARFEERKEG